MSKLEKFSLITGIIGLIADVIGLFVIFKSYQADRTSGKPVSSLLHLLILFLYIYGWFTINWILIRNKKRQQKNVDEGTEMFAFLLGSGIFLLPFVSLWLYLLMAGNMSNIFLVDAFFAVSAAVLLNLIVGAGILISTGMLIPALGED